MSPILRSAPRRIAGLCLLVCSSTLLCCALPAALVLVGAGSVMASLLSWWPSLSLVSEQKTLVFVIAGASLVVAGVGLRQSARLPCPVDPLEAGRCRRRLRQARWLYGVSCGAYLVGSLAAYVLPLLHG